MRSTTAHLTHLARRIRPLEWRLYVSRKFNWFLEETQIRANSRSLQQRLLGFSVACDNYLILDGDEYSIDQDTARRSATFARKFARDPDFFTTFARSIFGFARSASREKQRLLASDFRSLSNHELRSRVEAFAEVYLLSCVASWSRPDSYLEQQLSEIMHSRFSADEAHQALQTASTCPYPEHLLYANEYLDLLRIARSVQARHVSLESLPPSITKALHKHATTYAWLKSPVAISEDAFSKTEYVQRLRHLCSQDPQATITSILRLRAGQKSAFLRLMRRCRFSTRERRIIKAAREFIFLRTFATEISDELFYTARTTLLREAGSRLGLSGEEVTMLSASEIIQALSAPTTQTASALRQAIQARSESFSIIWLGGKAHTFSGAQSKRLNMQLTRNIPRQATSYSNHKLIKGASGNIGLVIGKARLVHNSRHVHKLRRGDILVTSMTTPDLIAAMERAAGFVTDEGGMTCHAAIVARELGVPCVIGTSHASRVIKDGDLVCVDGSRGEVSYATHEQWRSFIRSRAKSKAASSTKVALKAGATSKTPSKSRDSHQLVLTLEEARDQHFSILGGKAASLARMAARGITIPDAFVITTNLYGNIDRESQKLILAHFDHLGAETVSVRSSATVEDSAEHSFAGQFDSFLNVTRKDLIRRVRQCQRSATNARVVEYCRRTGVSHSDVKVAVIVQRMIDSEYSGVLFTKNPLSNDRAAIVIEVVAGLGEALVSGKVTPATYLVRRDRGTLISYRAGAQRQKLVRKVGGGSIWRPVRASASLALTPDHIKQLRTVSLRVERLFKTPVDVEWALHRGTLYLLQARPITR